MSRQKRQTRTARAKKKTRVVQRKKEDESVKGPVLSHLSSGRREAESFTVRPEESNSMEQELSAVN